MEAMNAVDAPASDINSEASILFGGLFSSYLDSLGDDIRSPKARIAIVRQASDGYMHTEYFAGIYEAGCRAADLREERVNAFFAVAPRKKESRKTQAIPHILTLHADVDTSGGSVESRIKQEKPSALVSSGRGLHAYWFLESPLQCSKYATVARDLNRELAKRLDGDLNATDIARILRMPGTFNVKNPNKPLPVEIIEFEPKVRYPLDYLIGRFGLDLHLNNRSLEVVDGSLNEFIPRGRFLGADERVYVDSLLRDGLFKQQSRNDATLLLCRHCLEQGMSRDEAKTFIADFFETKHNGLSQDWLADKAACIRHIGAAVDDCWKKAANWKQIYRGRRGEDANRRLSVSDVSYVNSLCLSKRDKLFLMDALEFILNYQRDGVLILESRQIMKFRYCHSRNYQDRYKLLIRFGIIEPKATYKKAERLGAEFYVLYNFREDGEREPNNQADAAHMVEVEEKRLPLAA